MGLTNKGAPVGHTGRRLGFHQEFPEGPATNLAGTASSFPNQFFTLSLPEEA